MPGDSDKTGESPEDPAAANPGELVAREAEREIAAKIERLLPSDRPIAPHELAKVLAQVVSVEIREAYSFQGPMPPPSMLREYDAALPGLAERLVARAEAEQQFRHKTGEFQMDTVSKEQWHAAAKTYLGQILAFIIAMTAIGGGIILLALGKSTAGLASIIAALVALVAVFIAGKVVEALRAKADQPAPKPPSGP